MTWDDHDIFDGWGSYPDTLQNCPVFQGCYQAARRFYLLFQQHTNLQRIGETDLFGHRHAFATHKLSWMHPCMSLQTNLFGHRQAFAFQHLSWLCLRMPLQTNCLTTGIVYAPCLLLVEQLMHSLLVQQAMWQCV